MSQTPRTAQQIIEAQTGALAFSLAVMTAENERLRAENAKLREELVKVTIWKPSEVKS